jgi:glycosyltransferase involved in cell wall biosynthesis
MENTHPEVSVVIPCYNGERFVAEAIDSILAQTRGNPDVIVVDDGSSDGSVGVVERYASGGRVRLIRHDSNQGIAAARNTGIRHARGRFIGFLDQDDLWKEDKLAIQLEMFKRDASGGMGVVFGRFETHDVNTNARDVSRRIVPANVDRVDPDHLLTGLLLGNTISIGTALIKRECFDELGLLDERIRSGADDLELFVRLAQRYDFGYIDRPVKIRRDHELNYTNPGLMVPDVLDILERVVTQRPDLGWVRKRSRSHHLFFLARYLHLNRRYSDAGKAYLGSIRARPSNVRAYAGLILLGLAIPGAAFSGARKRRSR